MGRQSQIGRTGDARRKRTNIEMLRRGSGRAAGIAWLFFRGMHKSQEPD